MRLVNGRTNPRSSDQGLLRQAAAHSSQFNHAALSAAGLPSQPRLCESSRHRGLSARRAESPISRRARSDCSGACAACARRVAGGWDDNGGVQDIARRRALLPQHGRIESRVHGGDEHWGFPQMTARAVTDACGEVHPNPGEGAWSVEGMLFDKVRGDKRLCEGEVRPRV